MSELLTTQEENTQEIARVRDEIEAQEKLNGADKISPFGTNDTRVFKRDQWPDGLYNDWMPTVEDQNIVRKKSAA